MSARLRPEFAGYRSWAFDCDGVLLDSNAVKTQAFRDVATPYGQAAADALVDYHVTHGGVSRFIKVDYFFNQILGRPPEDGEVDQFLKGFAQSAMNRLLTCPEAPRIREVLAAVAATGPVYIVSGGLQNELREIFTHRGLDHFFTAIFGSPDTKDEILGRERASGAMADPALFIGDARYDYEVAQRFGLDFAFASDWTEFSDWQTYFQDKSVTHLHSIQDLLAR